MLNEKVGQGILKVRNKNNKTIPLSTHKNFLSRTALTDANCLIKFEKSMIFASAFSIERMARSASLDCPMVDRRYVFINFNFENDLTALATVTGIVRYSVNTFCNCGNTERIRYSYRSCRSLRTVFWSPISLRNSTTNDLVSLTNSSEKSK